MPSAKNFDVLEEQVGSRPGATERLDQLRQETLKEIEVYEQSEASGASSNPLVGREGPLTTI